MKVLRRIVGILLLASPLLIGLAMAAWEDSGGNVLLAIAYFISSVVGILFVTGMMALGAILLFKDE